MHLSCFHSPWSRCSPPVSLLPAPRPSSPLPPSNFCLVHPSLSLLLPPSLSFTRLALPRPQTPLSPLRHHPSMSLFLPLFLVHQAHLPPVLCSWPRIYLHSNRPLISSSQGACVEMVIMEWAWRGSSPGPLLRASRPGSMALIHFVNVRLCVCVCVCGCVCVCVSVEFSVCSLWVKERTGCVKVTAPECLFMRICAHARKCVSACVCVCVWAPRPWLSGPPSPPLFAAQTGVLLFKPLMLAPPGPLRTLQACKTTV